MRVIASKLGWAGLGAMVGAKGEKEFVLRARAPSRRGRGAVGVMKLQGGRVQWAKESSRGTPCLHVQGVELTPGRAGAMDSKKGDRLLF